MRSEFHYRMFSEEEELDSRLDADLEQRRQTKQTWVLTVRRISAMSSVQGARPLFPSIQSLRIDGSATKTHSASRELNMQLYIPQANA